MCLVSYTVFQYIPGHELYMQVCKAALFHTHYIQFTNGRCDAEHAGAKSVVDM